MHSVLLDASESLMMRSCWPFCVIQAKHKVFVIVASGESGTSAVQVDEAFGPEVTGVLDSHNKGGE
jgi:hypothetical protein